MFVEKNICHHRSVSWTILFVSCKIQYNAVYSLDWQYNLRRTNISVYTKCIPTSDMIIVKTGVVVVAEHFALQSDHHSFKSGSETIRLCYKYIDGRRPVMIRYCWWHGIWGELGQTWLLILLVIATSWRLTQGHDGGQHGKCWELLQLWACVRELYWRGGLVWQNWALAVSQLSCSGEKSTKGERNREKNPTTVRTLPWWQFETRRLYSGLVLLWLSPVSMFWLSSGTWQTTCKLIRQYTRSGDWVRLTWLY